MSNLLSLVLGRSFSPGLSGGATSSPSSSSGTAFAELLAAPAAGPDAPLVIAPVRTGEAAALPAVSKAGDLLGVAETATKAAVPLPDGAQPPAPQTAAPRTSPAVSGAAPQPQKIAIDAALAATTEATLQPASQPANGEDVAVEQTADAPTDQDVEAPAPEAADALAVAPADPGDVLPQQPSHAPLSPEQAGPTDGQTPPVPGRETETGTLPPVADEQSAAIASVAPEDGGTSSPQTSSDHASAPAELAISADIAPPAAPATPVANTIIAPPAPPPAQPSPPVADSAETGEPDVPADKRGTGAGLRNITGEAERGTVQRSLDATPDAGTASDFAKHVQADAGEAAPPFAEGGRVGEASSQTRVDQPKSPAMSAELPVPTPATIPVRAGKMGHQLGVEVARSSLDGRDSLTIRLDPIEFGEIQIRLQFDEKGSLRAHIAAESSVALEMLRRESGDLVRALGDAGLRTDAQSLQFDARGHGRGEQREQSRPPAAPWQQGDSQSETAAEDQPARRKLFSGAGSIDLIA